METVIEIEPRPKEHPTSHYRPDTSEEEEEEQELVEAVEHEIEEELEEELLKEIATLSSSSTTDRPAAPTRRPIPPHLQQDPTVRIVRPEYGDFGRRKNKGRDQYPPAANASSNVGGVREEEDDEGVIHDITGTTVYVVGVICVIPAAGLVAWVVRYIMRRRVLSSVVRNFTFA